MKAGVDDEDFGEGVGQLFGIARVCNDLPDGPERRHGDEVRLHQAAVGLLGIEKVALESGAVALGQLVEDFLLVVGFEAFEQVGGVVGVEVADGPREDVVGERLGELVADLFVDPGEDLEVEVRP